MATTSPRDEREPHLLIRADAGAQIGAGHVMRCLALAQAWQLAGGAVTLASAAIPEAIAARVAAAGVTIRRIAAAAAGAEDLSATIEAARDMTAAWVVVDGYAFDAAFERGVAGAGARLLALDDEGRQPHAAAALVLNQNLHASADAYPGRSLIGPRFALLRREFVERDARTLRPTVERIVVTLGGGRAGPALPIVLDALRAALAPGIAIDVVAQPAAEVRADIESRLRQFPAGVIRWHERSDDMAALLADADVAVSAAGSTTWELMFLGIPALLTAIADNQRPVAETAAAAGAAINLGPVEQLTSGVVAAALETVVNDAGLRARLSAAGRRTVDGEGAARTVQAMTGAPLRLRRARLADAHVLWEWANDPLTRAASFNSDPIPWETHVTWLERTLRDPHAHLWIGVDAADRDAGQVRFQSDGDAAVISVALAPAFRGRGLGAALIDAGSRRMLAAGRYVIAYVRPDNAPSLAAFRKAGYRERGRTQVGRHAALRFELTTSDAQSHRD